MARKTELDDYVDETTKRFWLRIGNSIEASGKTCRSISEEIGCGHSLIRDQVERAKKGAKTRDTKIELVAHICGYLGRPISYFLDDS